MKRQLLPLCLALALTLSACSSQQAEVTPTPELTPTPPVTAPTPTPEYTGPRSPLTGLPMDEKWEGKRPVAIMLNNIKEALPQQGQSEADLLYECLEEGGITRMMGVYQDLSDVGTVGSIRSARSYYLELALGHDAVYIHAGGSDVAGVEDAYGKIRAWGVTSLDGVRGPYMSNAVEGNLMWRDPARIKQNGHVHSVVTTGAMIEKRFVDYTFRKDHEEDWAEPLQFAEDGSPRGGETAGRIEVPFSSYKTGVFTYDPAAKRYLVEEYGAAYLDGNTGKQVGVTNVIVVKADHGSTGDSYGHITMDLTGKGEGYYACGGKLVPIQWSKPDHDSPLTYTYADGSPLVLGRGSTYVNIIPTENAVAYS